MNIRSSLRAPSYRALALVLLLATMLMGAAPAGAPAPSKGDVGAMSTERMRMQFDANNQQMAIWMAQDFFKLCGQLSPNGGDDEQLKLLEPYIIVAVMRSNDDRDGTSHYASEQQVHSSSVIALDNGKQLKPLDKVPPRVSVIAAAMKAGMAAKSNSADHMFLLFFPAKTADGKPVVDSSKKDKLKLVLDPLPNMSKTEMVWRTPFDATNPATPCKSCKEPISAKWSYCPYCGAKAE
jgi:hypothetical protein